jgi:hypothetical protein
MPRARFRSLMSRKDRASTLQPRLSELRTALAWQWFHRRNVLAQGAIT